MRIGYACLTIGVPGTQLHACTRAHASEERLLALTAANLSALDAMLSYNLRQGIRLFRISSDIIPFASHPDITFPWRETFREELQALGAKARDGGMRLSMHPGQYTVLNSPDADVVRRAIADLQYHCAFLDTMGMGTECKVILHVGGAYGDKKAAMKRFQTQYSALDASVRSRLVIENDDKLYTVEEVLALGEALGIPVVLDTLHHAVNPAQETRAIGAWVADCAATWKPQDGPQKIHYAQQAAGKRAGSHAETIQIEPFLRFAKDLPCDMDIMLEVKDKNLSAVKCILCLKEHGNISALEAEWARYKYLVLEHAPAIYQSIRLLLKDKAAFPSIPFYALVEQATQTPCTIGNSVNAAQHVWGYFKQLATAAEKKRFARLLEGFSGGSASSVSVKRFLWRLAEKYQQNYLLASYYFVQ